MKVLIFGAGAVGTVLAAMLSPNHEIDVMVRGERERLVAEEGLTVRGMVERTVRPGVGAKGIYDIIFITTKAYDTATAAEAVEAYADEHSVIASLQNGMGNLDVLAERFGERAVIGLTTLGATSEGPTTIRLVDRGRTTFGSPSEGGEGAATVAAMLKSSGLDSVVAGDIRAEMWMKAVVNACINPLAALAGSANGGLLEHPPLMALSRQACGEAAMAAKEHGVALPADPFSKVKEVIWATRSNRCSMLQDLEAGRRTEIDEITGELVRRGEARGMEMPVNRSLWVLMRAAEGRPLVDRDVRESR